MSTFDSLVDIAKGRRKKFPQGNNPHIILARLLEEAGELAQTVNHYEGISSKDRTKAEKTDIAKESVDVIQNVLALLIQYNLLEEFDHEVESSKQKLKEDGFLEK